MCHKHEAMYQWSVIGPMEIEFSTNHVMKVRNTLSMILARIMAMCFSLERIHANHQNEALVKRWLPPNFDLDRLGLVWFGWVGMLCLWGFGSSLENIWNSIAKNIGMATKTTNSLRKCFTMLTGLNYICVDFMCMFRMEDGETHAFTLINNLVSIHGEFSLQYFVFFHVFFFALKNCLLLLYTIQYTLN